MEPAGVARHRHAKQWPKAENREIQVNQLDEGSQSKTNIFSSISLTNCGKSVGWGNMQSELSDLADS